MNSFHMFFKRDLVLIAYVAGWTWEGHDWDMVMIHVHLQYNFVCRDLATYGTCVNLDSGNAVIHMDAEITLVSEDTTTGTTLVRVRVVDIEVILQSSM